jgi:hypothetical protein
MPCPGRQPAHAREQRPATARGLGRVQERRQPIAQPLRVEPPLDDAVDGEGDHPALLGDHDDRGVRLLRKADRGTVARAERARESEVARQREKAASCRDPVALDQRGPVVERRSGLEHAPQELGRDDRLHLHTQLRVGAQPYLALHGDQGADALEGQHLHRPHDLVEELAPRRPRLPRHAQEQRVSSRVGQRTAQLRLEEDHQRQDPERPEVLEHEREAPEVRPAARRDARP